MRPFMFRMLSLAILAALPFAGAQAQDGGRPALKLVVATGLLQGDIQCSFVTSLESASLVQSGKMRILGVAARQRLPSLPGVLAIAEELPGFESVLWFAAFAPKGTRDEDAQRLRNALVRAVESPEFRKYLADHYAQARASTPEELTQLVRRDMLHWAEVARTARVSM